ncbi:MATE family efflux transporter [Parvularcula dongshanensis]|uniref:Putative MATE family efflux protein n=1 Tax=Parvularcula dongshanensis TaxID=1173995 RepID=A0A840I3C2_9PROT|nr:MATE family efflux transporter [Parvularcula dongshanensis]MBB4658825.1 putative MATE family efflux protein [Parvularcula dongshanensis]
MASNRDLTSGPVASGLARLALPMVLGVGATLSVSLADAYFLGRLGTAALAAISFTFPVVLTVTSLAIGLSAGAASVLSRAIGAGRGEADAARLATDALLLALLVILPAGVIGFVTVEPVFRLLGADGEVLAALIPYMRVWYASLPFLAVPIVASGILRANGDAVAPSAIMITIAVLNLALDPILIFGLGPAPELGVEGAGWASLAARIVGTVATLLVLRFRERLLTFSLPIGRNLLASWRSILKVAGPASLSNVVNPLGISVVTAFLAGYGNEVVAAFGVATRIESLASIPLLALSGSIGPVAGQNWGKGRKDRTRRSMQLSYAFSCLWAAVVAAVFWTAAGPIVSVFGESGPVQDSAASYLRIVGLSLFGYGVVITASAAYNATDRARGGLVFTLLRSAVLYVPLAGLAALLGPAWFVFAAIAAANVVSGLAVWFVSLARASGGCEDKFPLARLVPMRLKAASPLRRERA